MAALSVLHHSVVEDIRAIADLVSTELGLAKATAVEYIHVIPDPSRCQDLIDFKISKAVTCEKIKNIHFLSPFELKYGILNGENVIMAKEFVFQRAGELSSNGWMEGDYIEGFGYRV